MTKNQNVNSEFYCKNCEDGIEEDKLKLAIKMRDGESWDEYCTRAYAEMKKDAKFSEWCRKLRAEELEDSLKKLKEQHTEACIDFKSIQNDFQNFSKFNIENFDVFYNFWKKIENFKEKIDVVEKEWNTFVSLEHGKDDIDWLLVGYGILYDEWKLAQDSGIER